MCIYLLTNNFLSIVLTLGIGRCTHRHGYKPHSFVRDENLSTESLAIMKSPGRSMALWRNCQKVMHICLSLPKQSSNPLSRNVLSVSPKSFNAAKMFVNLFQTIYTLVNGLRYQIQRFVFAAFPLTVAPCSHVHRQSLESLDDDVVYVWGSIGASCFPCHFRVRSASGLFLYSAPAIGGFVVVAQMISAYGNCQILWEHWQPSKTTQVIQLTLTHQLWTCCHLRSVSGILTSRAVDCNQHSTGAFLIRGKSILRDFEILGIE